MSIDQELERGGPVRRKGAPEAIERLSEAFSRLTPEERQLLVCALAGNHPERLAHCRMPVLRGLARSATVVPASEEAA